MAAGNSTHERNGVDLRPRGGEPGFREIEVVLHLESTTARDELGDLVEHALAVAPIPNTVQRPVPVVARLA